MQALDGTPGARAAAARAAGCDVALHCSGVLDETRSVLDAIEPATADLAARLVAARHQADAARQRFDVAALTAERATLLG
jgi:beta-N-acetylhexosaminidase